MEHIPTPREEWNEALEKELDAKFEQRMSTPEAQARIEQETKDQFAIANMTKVEQTRQKLRDSLAHALRWKEEHESLPRESIDPNEWEMNEDIISKRKEQLATLGGDPRDEAKESETE